MYRSALGNSSLKKSPVHKQRGRKCKNIFEDHRKKKILKIRTHGCSLKQVHGLACHKGDPVVCVLRMKMLTQLHDSRQVEHCDGQLRVGFSELVRQSASASCGKSRK